MLLFRDMYYHLKSFIEGGLGLYTNAKKGLPNLI